ncbi:restriction endonuclease subunit S [Lacticaseibacillus paracasei]|jgi:type I restriction enzyme S subunit|uniref:restriction endonuclease subunit S n=4 Tax=Lacticaseibacillus paracasei TaxID=1597 RepID=UPI0031F4F724
MITEQHVPQFRFKGFSDSWEQRKFSELFQKSSEKNTNLSFSRSQVLTGATMTDSDRDINSDDDYMKTYNVIHVGDILFEGHTSKQFAFGRFVLDDYRDGIVSHVFDIYRPKAKMNLSFWKYYIHDENVMRPILVRATSNARMLNALSSSEFLKQSVFVPSENEQAKIGNLLEQIDSTIALHQRKLELLKRLKQGYLQKLFPQNGENVPELRFKGYSDAWKKRKLGELAEFINGRAYKQDELLASGKYPVLRVGNFYTNDKWYYSNLELPEKYYAEEGDLLYTWSATFGPHIWIGPKVIYHYHIWKVALKNIFEKDFALQFFEADRVRLLNSTNGSTMIHVTKKDMESKGILLPDVYEQRTIGDLLKRVDHLIAATQHKVDLLKKLKQGYLQKMFC